MLEHLTGSRARIRMPQLRRDRDACEKLATAATALAGVSSVEASPLTAGVLIRYRGNFGEIAEEAAKAGIFRLAAPTPEPALMAGLRAQVGKLNEKLKQGSTGTLDINTAAFMLFGAVGIVQLARGRVAMPALSALWYALNSLRAAGFDEKPASPGDTAADD
ncbi:MAG: hypothetical protein K9G30_09075 [Parvibaculum sp.]|nr:hypothetical protein [Parvibaculum sp.]